MKPKSLVWIALALLVTPWLESGAAGTGASIGARGVGDPAAPHWRVRLTLRSGESRETTLDGVGCSQSLCSRVAIRARAERGGQNEQLIRFGEIRSIQVRGAGRVTIDRFDGSSEQLVVPVENRVLYLIDPRDSLKRLDVRELSAIEFLR